MLCSMVLKIRDEQDFHPFLTHQSPTWKAHRQHTNRLASAQTSSKFRFSLTNQTTGVSNRHSGTSGSCGPLWKLHRYLQKPLTKLTNYILQICSYYLVYVDFLLLLCLFWHTSPMSLEKARYDNCCGFASRFQFLNIWNWYSWNCEKNCALIVLLTCEGFLPYNNRIYAMPLFSLLLLVKKNLDIVSYCDIVDTL